MRDVQVEVRTRARPLVGLVGIGGRIPDQLHVHRRIRDYAHRLAARLARLRRAIGPDREAEMVDAGRVGRERGVRNVRARLEMLHAPGRLADGPLETPDRLATQARSREIGPQMQRRLRHDLCALRHDRRYVGHAWSRDRVSISRPVVAALLGPAAGPHPCSRRLARRCTGTVRTCVRTSIPTERAFAPIGSRKRRVGCDTRASRRERPSGHGEDNGEDNGAEASIRVRTRHRGDLRTARERGRRDGIAAATHEPSGSTVRSPAIDGAARRVMLLRRRETGAPTCRRSRRCLT